MSDASTGHGPSAVRVLAFGLAALAAIALTIGIAARAPSVSHPPAKPTTPSPTNPSTGSSAAGPSIDASNGDVDVEVAQGVRYRVPAWAKHARVDASSIAITANNATILVAVSKKPKLASPIDGIVSLAKDEKLKIDSITTEGEDRTLGRMSGPQKVAAIYIVVTKTFRVVVYMRADGPQNFDPLVEDFVHGSRLLLP